jgi:ergothioneine biosynthesis protein EgtB
MATTEIAVQDSHTALTARYADVRRRTEWLCETLEPEDMTVSSMPDVSPTKWHLAHTSWFFETFVLSARDHAYAPLDPRYAYLFNSYYVQAGERHCRAQRGLVTRPTVSEVFAYRRHVDEHMRGLLDGLDADPTVTLGLHHEQQHQELILTDIQHVFWMNPLRPAYGSRLRTYDDSASNEAMPAWRSIHGGIHHIGHSGDDFAFDNESPSHRVLIEDFEIASHLVTNGEFLEFIEDGGYRRPDLWLAAGLALVLEQGREAPFYWERDDDLPDLCGARWQWTQSAYVAYPGYAPAAGALGEYNGKWMSDQWVLRGSSFATPPGHARVTYRNFFPSDTRWQFTGIRLAK